MARYRSLAREFGIWLSLGGFQERAFDNNAKMHSIFSARTVDAHVILDSSGEIKAVYRKVHLFDVSLGKNSTSRESQYVSAGKELANPVDTPIGRLGLSVVPIQCEPIVLRCPVPGDIPAPVLCRGTGSGHPQHLPAQDWRGPLGSPQPLSCHVFVLIEHRDRENECYVVSAAQVGQHSKKRGSYGHSMIVDPWGKIVWVSA